MNPRHFQCLVAGIGALAATHLCGAPPSAGRVVYRFQETVTLSKCDAPESPEKKTNYMRSGYLLLDSQASVENWMRILSELETEGTNVALPSIRSEMSAVDERLRSGHGIPWGVNADGIAVSSSPANDDPMGEGVPLAPDALALPTVLPPRSATDGGTNTIRLRFASRVFPLAYVVCSNTPTAQTVSLSKKNIEQRGAAGIWQLQSVGQWTVTCAKDEFPDCIEGEFQLTWRQRWKSDGAEYNIVIFSVASRFVYSRMGGVDFDNERIFERAAPDGKDFHKP